MTAGLAASIHARLLNRAKARGEDFNLILTRYAIERFLYRLSSGAGARCLLAERRVAVRPVVRRAASANARRGFSWLWTGGYRGTGEPRCVKFAASP